MAKEKPKVISSLAQLTIPQIRAVMQNCTIKAVCEITAPPLDMAAIDERTAVLPTDNQQRNDIYSLMHEVGKLRYEAKNAKEDLQH